MKYFELDKNKVFIGNIDKLSGWCPDEEDQSKAIEKVRLLLKNYLELDNVSFLFGSGSSIHLGAVAIRNFPKEVEDHIVKSTAIPGYEDVYVEFLDVLKKLQAGFYNDIILDVDFKTDTYTDERGWKYIVKDSTIRDFHSGDLYVEFEKVLNYLIALDYVYAQQTEAPRTDKINILIKLIKEGLFLVCDVDTRDVPKDIIYRKKNSDFELQKHHAKLLEGSNKYIFHEKFIKALLQRPLNLRRANIFTANYDLAFEYAFDRLGVHYIDGFAGFHKRYFKPETFEFDLFYPGSTTSGKVQRIEKVVRYYKLHGSLSWVNSDKRDANNLYGIEELPLKLIASEKKKGEIIVYPSAVKKSYTLDLPYSELFRQFASTITQSQSVLITVGYSFADEHFNDIIFQALSNPTFTLIIVDFKGTDSKYIDEIKELNDSRVIILQGEFFGDFLTFADTLMPNFIEVDNREKVADTLNRHFEKDNK